jgi:hypothetical protein
MGVTHTRVNDKYVVMMVSDRGVIFVYHFRCCGDGLRHVQLNRRVSV